MMRWEQCLKSRAQGRCHGNARSLGHATRARWEVAELWKAFGEHDLLVSVQLASARSTHSVSSPYHLEAAVALQLDYGICVLGFIWLMVLSIPYVPGSVFTT